jgi:beta-carotene hydroxylase
VRPYRGRFEWRIIATFLAFSAAWVTVIVLGTNGTIPLWLGFLLNAVVASTFYMPLHEAVHGNIWGDQTRARWGEDLIGIACSVPLVGTSYSSHRTVHMRHHAYTNDPTRDPDHFADGSLLELIPKLIAFTVFGIFLPVFAFIPPTRRLLPAQMQQSLSMIDDDLRRAGVQQGRFWILIHAALLAAFLLGLGWEALFLWYLPARVAAMWLAFIFAWFPHHPADRIGRYVDTRIAVFPGARWLARGHEYHALHHLFPRVPHYRLRSLWVEVGEGLVDKGVRAEGRAPYATGPIVW